MEFLVDFTSGPRDEEHDSITVEVILDRGDDIEILGPYQIDDTEPLDVYGLIFARIFDALGWCLMTDPCDFEWEEVTDYLSTPHYRVEVPTANRIAVWSSERRKYVAHCTDERTIAATIARGHEF